MADILQELLAEQGQQAAPPVPGPVPGAPPPSAPGQGIVPEPAAPGQSAPAAPDILQELLTEQDARPELDIVQLPELTELPITSGLGFVDQLKTLGKQLVLTDPEDLAQSLSGNPAIKILRNRKNEPFAEIGGKRYALNKPGASVQDFIPLATSLITNIGADVALLPFTGPAAPAAGGAVTGALQAGAESLAKTGQLPSAGDVGKGAAVGAAGGAAGGLLGAVLKGPLGAVIRKTGKLIDDATGEITKTAREAFKAVGINVDDVAIPQLLEAEKLLKGRAATPETLRQSLAQVDEAATGIPLTTGQRTGNLEQLNTQVAGEQGILGQEAQETAAAFAARQREARGQAVENIGQQVAPQATLGGGESATGQRVLERVQEAQLAARARVKGAYGEVERLSKAANLGLQTATPSGTLASRAERILTKNLPEINEQLTPATASVLRRLGKIGDTPITTFDALRGERRVITDLIRENRVKNPTDARALTDILKEFDDFTQETVTRATAGSQQGKDILAAFKTARGEAADRFSRFTRGENDLQGKVIEDIVNGEISPETLTNRLLGGSNEFTSDGAAVYARLRRALGGDDPVLDDVKRSALFRIVGGSSNQQALEGIGAQAAANNIKKALGGKGERYASQIFGSKGTEELRTLERQLRRQIRPEALRNPSGTQLRKEFNAATRIRRAIGYITGLGVGGATGVGVGMVAGPVAGAAVGAAAGGLGKKLADRAAAGYGRKAFDRLLEAPGSPAAAATKQALANLPGRAMLPQAFRYGTAPGALALPGILSTDRER